MMEIIRGTHALSEFEITKLLTRCDLASLPINKIASEYIYFIDVKKALEKSEKVRLSQLLTCDMTKTNSQSAASLSCITVPRIGTISSWSSKATDIAHNCNFNGIKRIERGTLFYIDNNLLTLAQLMRFKSFIHDPMMEQVIDNTNDAKALFTCHQYQQMHTIDIQSHGKNALIAANKSMGLALNDGEINYLYKQFMALKRNPNDIELMMFAQANSEHCRHKIFNADWVIDGKKQSHSLFSMIKNTHKVTPCSVLSAYKDNAAVMEGNIAGRFYPDNQGIFAYHCENIDILMKVETHNHPTAISPYPGAATGSGGEIRDEGATGKGAKPKAGLTGFCVSNLQISNFIQPWEMDYGKPTRIDSPLNIMLDGPLGAANFNNEFGRPALLGFFRTYEQTHAKQVWGYHKPIMLAGGLGNIKRSHINKGDISVGAKLIVLGGPAMNIGLGGGAASSMSSGQSCEELDFSSVQRDNPEMERRCQEVIDKCWQMGDNNPIQFIHDVGAGGLSNALPELVSDGGCGGKFTLNNILCDEKGMSPLAIWCNESQERYVLAVDNRDLSIFTDICHRERAPFCIVGEATQKHELVLTDEQSTSNPIDLPLSVLLGKTPKMIRNTSRIAVAPTQFNTQNINIEDAIERILHLPTIADKSFLITIGDRSVTGQVCRDQMVGPWQVPVADCAVTATSFDSYFGEAMSIGERPPIALLNHAASARMAVAEAITNIASVNICDSDTQGMKRIKLSANWMAAAGHKGEDAGIYDAVKAIGMEICPALGLTIPVGKDSMSMKTSWTENHQQKLVTSPLSVIITAFAPVQDVRDTITPVLVNSKQPSVLLLLDIANGKQRLGGSSLCQVYNQLGDTSPDLDNAASLMGFFQVTQKLIKQKKILAYHDRSDGGLFVTLLEMALAGNLGIDVNIGGLIGDNIERLFNEELGAVIQIHADNAMDIIAQYEHQGISSHIVGHVNSQKHLSIFENDKQIISYSLSQLTAMWSRTSYEMQKIRDNPECAYEEYQHKQNTDDPGLSINVTFDHNIDVAAPYIASGVSPKMAILREQGVNSQLEMAAAFDRAGFDAVDVHMSDILAGRINLNDFYGLAVCGGFSYGDVLGAGRGWANSILFNEKAKDQFSEFFARENSFALGVCNGCQMLSHLRSIIPNTEHWPTFVRNRSERFEARFSLVEVQPSPSIFLQGMAGSRIPIAVSHGEGQVKFTQQAGLATMEASDTIALRFVDGHGKIAKQYPLNPNGSANGITGVTSLDGKVTIMMPHPERVFRTVSNSWYPSDWKEDSPWMRMFRNARVSVG